MRGPVVEGEVPHVEEALLQGVPEGGGGGGGDGEWMEQDHREDPGSQEEARSHSRVGEACEAMVPTVKRKKIRLSMKKRKGILRSNQ